MARMNNQNVYESRLETFLSRIAHVQTMSPKRAELHEIMDTVPFRDLETALMMATMEYGQDAAGNDR